MILFGFDNQTLKKTFTFKCRFSYLNFFIKGVTYHFRIFLFNNNAGITGFKFN